MCANCNFHPDLSDLPSGWCRMAVTGSLVTLSIALCKMPSPPCLCFPATQGVRVRLLTCCIRNTAAVEKWGKNIPLFLFFSSLLCQPRAQLAVVLSSLNTLSTVPVWLPANIWAMGKGQGTNIRSPNSHPPSCLSQSGMQRTFSSSCNLSHRTSKPSAAATSVPFLSLRLGRGQELVGIS